MVAWTHFSIPDEKDIRWLIRWWGGVMTLWIWLLAFLNAPARHKIEIAFLNTLLIATLSTLLALALAWGQAVLIYYARRRSPLWAQVTDTLFSAWRSLPQILGILFGYVFIAYRQSAGDMPAVLVLILLALIAALVIFPEIGDMLLERIDYFRKSDFFNAMRVAGIPDSRIINYDILYKNSPVHILNKCIAVFAMTFFLLISVDFIVSVGLARQVNLVNMPRTLGNMLAHIDSKQDILALGQSLSRPSLWLQLPFAHLQGLATAFLIVFSLICLFKISQYFSERLHD
ncbi:MAG: hypothetical protein D6677_06945 [Calditrichaeota bacterium]|nr:MAG: hypothetical protein D6677_06945 [Calditrichota bacterium]